MDETSDLQSCPTFYVHLKSLNERHESCSNSSPIKSNNGIQRRDFYTTGTSRECSEKPGVIATVPEIHLTSEQNINALSTPNDYEVILSPRRWVILFIFSLISMTNAAMWISLSSISSIVKRYYKISFASANWLSMIFSLTYFFVVLSVFALNTYGLKFTICIGALINALGSGLKLIGSGRGNFKYAILGNGLAGIAQSFILFIPPTLAATWFGEKERGIASAIGMLMNMLGVSLGYIMGGTIVPNSSDYDGVVKTGMFKLLLSQAIVSILLAILSITFIQSSPMSPPSMSQLLLNEQKWEKKMDKRLTNDIELQLYISNEGAGRQSKVFVNKQEPEFNTDNFVVGFRKSFKLLLHNKDFHLITQAYGIFFGLYLAINTLLNHICTTNFPGKEKTISVMGSISVIIGLFGMLISGILIDKKHEYRFISIADFLMCAVSFFLFVLFSTRIKNFAAAFSCFCIYGFFSYPYMTIGLEHAAEVAFPVSEAVTSAILLLVANTYGILFTFLVELTLDLGGTITLGYFTVGLYIVGAIIVILIKGELKRFNADRNSKKGSFVQKIHQGINPT